jgi:hypothetical protein
MESVSYYLRNNLGIHSTPWPGFANAKEPRGPGYRCQDSINIHWFDRPQIDDLGFDAFAA